MADFESSGEITKDDYQDYSRPSSPLEQRVVGPSSPSRRKSTSDYLDFFFPCFPSTSGTSQEIDSEEDSKSTPMEEATRKGTIEPSEIRDGHKQSVTSKVYHPLLHDNSIRLLRIEPGDATQNLILTLEPVRLDDTLPVYEALSYVWGVEANEQVVCNGEDMPGITVNLVNALKRLRYTDRSRLVWCDGLCIDQHNPTEKGLQVRLMHHIYARAEKVIVLIGPDEEGHAKGAFGALCAMVNDKMKKQQQHPPSKTKHKTEPAVYEAIDPTHEPYIPVKTPPLDDEIWISVMYLFCQTWFLRMWVLQEIVLARYAVVVWGSFFVSWDVLGRGIDCVREHTYLHTILETRNLQNAFFMWNMCNIRRTSMKDSDDDDDDDEEDEENSFAFLQLLDIARSFDVTDAKDKVYGLLGFPTKDAGTETGVFIRPNYTQSLADLYTSVARKLLVKEGGLNVLSFVVHKGWRERVVEEKKDDVQEDTGASDMPSWVPNWNTKDVIYPLAGFGKHNAHRAGVERQLCLDFTASSEIETSSLSTLTLKGTIIDTIRDVGTAAHFQQLFRCEPMQKAIISWYLSAANPSAETLAKTLCAGRESDGRLVVDHEKNLADFMALLKDLEIDLETTWPETESAEIEMPDVKSRSGKHLAESVARKGDPDVARETMWRFSIYRAPFVTESGEIGLGPGATRPGDVVAVLWGGQVPFVLRRKDDGGRGWTFVGECYVEGLLSGKGVNGAEEVFELW